MGASYSHLVGNPPSRILMVERILIASEAVDLIWHQGFPFSETMTNPSAESINMAKTIMVGIDTNRKSNTTCVMNTQGQGLIPN